MSAYVMYRASGWCDVEVDDDQIRRDEWSVTVFRDGSILFEIPEGAVFVVGDREDLASIDAFFQALHEVSAIGQDIEDEMTVAVSS